MPRTAHRSARKILKTSERADRNLLLRRSSSFVDRSERTTSKGTRIYLYRENYKIIFPGSQSRRFTTVSPLLDGDKILTLCAMMQSSHVATGALDLHLTVRQNGRVSSQIRVEVEHRAWHQRRRLQLGKRSFSRKPSTTAITALTSSYDIDPLLTVRKRSFDI